MVMIEMFATYRQRLALLLALLVPVGAAAVLVPFRGNFTTTAAALVLVASVVAIAVLGSRVSGFVASVSAALWFDFFLTKPYYQFAISHRPDLETTIAIFVIGLIVTELAARSRHHSLVSFEEANYVAMIRDLTDLAARSSGSAAVIESVERSLTPLLNVRSCRFDAKLADPPLARIVSSGAVLHVGLDWPVSEIGIPGPEAEIVAEWRGRALGRFILTPSTGQPVSLERRVVAVLLVNVVGASLATETWVS
jgi:hypothetical protein